MGARAQQRHRGTAGTLAVIRFGAIAVHSPILHSTLTFNPHVWSNCSKASSIMTRLDYQ